MKQDLEQRGIDLVDKLHDAIQAQTKFATGAETDQSGKPPKTQEELGEDVVAAQKHLDNFLRSNEEIKPKIEAYRKASV